MHIWLWGRRALGAFQSCCRGTRCGNSPRKKEPMADQGCQVLPTCPYSGLGQHWWGGHPDSACGPRVCIWFLWLRQLVSSPPRLPHPSATSLHPHHLFLIRLFHLQVHRSSQISPVLDTGGRVPRPLPRCSDAQCSVRTVVNLVGWILVPSSNQRPWWP